MFLIMSVGWLLLALSCPLSEQYVCCFLCPNLICTCSHCHWESLTAYIFFMYCIICCIIFYNIVSCIHGTFYCKWQQGAKSSFPDLFFIFFCLKVQCCKSFRSQTQSGPRKPAKSQAVNVYEIYKACSFWYGLMPI